MNQEQIERFWAKIVRRGPDECWLWQASTAGKGYGQFRLPGTRRNVYAHRLAFQLHYGRELPRGKQVAHRCDTPRCCNPAHLFEATAAENQADMAAKNRSTFGTRNARAKLTDSQIEQIRSMAAIGIPQTRIGVAFGIHQVQVSRIVRRTQWRRSTNSEH